CSRPASCVWVSRVYRASFCGFSSFLYFVFNSMEDDNALPEEEKAAVRSGIMPVARAYIKLLGSWLAIWGLGYYKFSPCWVLLGTVGYLAYSRAQERRSLIRGAMKAISSDEKSYILNNIGTCGLPSWVFFPDIERAEWLNKIIQRMWPYISEYVNQILIETVQPAVNKNLPTSLRPFIFLRTDLGDSPPRIGGVKVYTEESIRRDEIVMDVDLMFYSDARIKVAVGKLVAGVKDFELRGTLRIFIKPLVPKIPFAGAVTACFLDNPYINFFLTHLGSILTMPGLQQTLYRTIQDVVGSLCVLPNRVLVPLVDDLVLQQLKFPSAQGAVRIEVISASDLVASDVNIVGKSSDPYCVVRVGAEKFVTSVKLKTLNPTWNECFVAIVDQRIGQSVVIEVWDEDKSSKDDELGLTSIPIEQVYLCGQLNLVKMLEGVQRGKVHVKLTWLDLSTNPSDFAVAELDQQVSFSSKTNFTSCLFVRVEQAKNLMRLKFFQEPSPYCVLQIGNMVQNTAVREKTQNPVWDSLHHFLLSNPEIQTLNIEIRDSRSEVVLGTLAVPLKHLKAEKDMTVTQPYSLHAAGQDNAFLYLHLELRALLPGPDRRPPAARGSVDSASHSRSPSPAATGPEVASLASEAAVATADSASGSDSVVRRRTGDSKVSTLSGFGSGEGIPPLVMPPDPAGRVRLTIHYDVDVEILEVRVDSAENLLASEKSTSSNPYAKLCVTDACGRTVGDTKKTRFIKDELNPHFDESFEFSVKSEVMQGCKLQVEIKNHSGLFKRSSPNRVMGSVTVVLSELANGGGFTEWYWLKNSER
uniref:Beta-1,4-galactosyltransferase n=3 Tax=Mesocestoides corti TaxID=53468 RepID=A0A5K3FBI6_MESCO